MKKLTHLDDSGTARMVDVGQKSSTDRVAIAQAVVKLDSDALGLLLAGNLPKGDALGASRIGAILAAKRTAELIPLCHPLPLTFADVNF